MDGEEVYRAVLDALTDHAAALEEKEPRVGNMLRIEPFDATTSDDEPVRVVGVIANLATDALDFVVIKAAVSGEMFPTTEDCVWRLDAHAEGAP